MSTNHRIIEYWIFGGISGAATVDMVTLGKIFIPSMTKEGYDKDFSTAVTLASAMISSIIPPSIIMVIYGAQMGVSIHGFKGSEFRGCGFTANLNRLFLSSEGRTHKNRTI